MKAIQVTKYGDWSVLQTNSAAPDPVIKDGQLLVSIKAVSINPFDISLRSGRLKDKIPVALPYIIGGDYAGVVISVGAHVSGFSVGDEVYGGAIILNGGSGTFAEKAAVNVANSAHKPTSIDFIASASLPLTGTSAVQAIEEHINIKEGQRILIHGGAGGIGSLAIQIAKSHGAYVIATAGGDGVAFVKSLGADEAIDYKTQDFTKVVHDVDAVFDTVGGDITNQSLSVLKKGGILLTMIGTPDEAKAKELGVTVIRQGTKTTIEHLTRLAALIDSGKVKPVVDKVFPLDEAAKAFEYFESAHPKGKVVLTVAP